MSYALHKIGDKIWIATHWSNYKHNIIFKNNLTIAKPGELFLTGFQRQVATLCVYKCKIARFYINYVFVLMSQKEMEWQTTTHKYWVS